MFAAMTFYEPLDLLQLCEVLGLLVLQGSCGEIQ